jgi:hypothetical protein
MPAPKPSRWWLVPAGVAAVVFVDEFVALFAGRSPARPLWPYNLLVLLAGVIWLIAICLRDAPPTRPFLRGLVTGAAFGLVQAAHWVAFAYHLQRLNGIAPTGAQSVLFCTLPPLSLAAILGLVVGGVVAGVVRLAGRRAGH